MKSWKDACESGFKDWLMVTTEDAELRKGENEKRKIDRERV